MFFLVFGGLQVSGGVPGEDFDMPNPNLRSRIAKSVTQRPTNEKNDLSIDRSIYVYDRLQKLGAYFEEKPPP